MNKSLSLDSIIIIGTDSWYNKLRSNNAFDLCFVVVQGWMVLRQFPPFRSFPDFHNCQNTDYLSNSRSYLTGVAGAKRCDAKNLAGIFARSKILLTEILTNRALVTPTPVVVDFTNTLQGYFVGILAIRLPSCHRNNPDMNKISPLKAVRYRVVTKHCTPVVNIQHFNKPSGLTIEFKFIIQISQHQKIIFLQLHLETQYAKGSGSKCMTVAFYLLRWTRQWDVMFCKHTRDVCTVCCSVPVGGTQNGKYTHIFLWPEYLNSHGPGYHNTPHYHTVFDEG